MRGRKLGPWAALGSAVVLLGSAGLAGATAAPLAGARATYAVHSGSAASALAAENTPQGGAPNMTPPTAAAPTTPPAGEGTGTGAPTGIASTVAGSGAGSSPAVIVCPPPMAAGTSGVAPAAVTGAAEPAFWCWPRPSVSLQPGQLAVRGTVHVLAAMCPVGATTCGLIFSLVTPEGTVHLSGNTGGLRSQEDVVAVGTWSVSSAGLAVDVAYAVPIEPVCPPLPKPVPVPAAEPASAPASPPATAAIACPL